MKNRWFSFCFITCLLVLAGSSSAKATELTDSIAPKNNGEPVKEVPKSRKQEKPLALVPVQVKPVAVKPKIIIKPIIKVH